MISCPKCGRIILDKTQDGGYKVRSRMLLFKDGKATALCPTCKTPVSVPLSLNDTASFTPKHKVIVNL